VCDSNAVMYHCVYAALSAKFGNTMRDRSSEWTKERSVSSISSNTTNTLEFI